MRLPNKAGYQRAETPRFVVIHTRLGKRVKVQPLDDDRLPWGEWYSTAVNKRARETKKSWVAAAPITVDHRGALKAHDDWRRRANYHAGKANRYSIGVELYQAYNRAVDPRTIEGGFQACEVLSFLTRIPKTGVRGLHRYGLVDSLLTRNLHRFAGVVGHSALSRTRGKGDPDHQIFDALAEDGWLLFETYRDYLNHWTRFQQAEGLTADGIVGPRTWDAWLDAKRCERQGADR